MGTPPTSSKSQPKGLVFICRSVLFWHATVHDVTRICQTEHIDNPKGYGEGEDARKLDSRLRGPVDVRIDNDRYALS
jgi:hypothetical protein